MSSVIIWSASFVTLAHFFCIVVISTSCAILTCIYSGIEISMILTNRASCTVEDRFAQGTRSASLKNRIINVIFRTGCA